jgi:hypothetical protein
MQNDYECPRCHNVFPSSNKTLHDIRCTEQNPLPLDQNKMEISKENENKEEEKIIPGPKIFTNDGNDNNDNNDNFINNNNNFINNNENNFEDNNKNNLMEEPPLEDFPEVFECDKCHELIYESEREDHMLCHKYQEEDNRINNPRNQLRISKINVEEQKRIERQIEQNKRKNRINQDQIRQNNSSNNNNYQNIFYDDFGDNILNNNNNNYIPNLNSINNNNNNNPYIRPNNPNRIRNYNNNNHINNNNNNNNRQHNRIRPNTGINQYNNNNNINQRVQVTIRQTGPNGEVISRFYPAYDIQNVQNVHRIRRNNNNNNNNRNNIEHPQHFVYLSSHRNFPFHNINNRQSIGTMFQELFSDLENSGVRATDRDILNELPETNIEDVSKLDSDKKNCVICLEDFKNREKAIILPCIHLFHKNCIKSWLKKNNSCPICKFKLTRDNLMGQNNNFE